MKHRTTTPHGPAGIQPESADSPSWRDQLRAAVRDPDELVDRLGLPDRIRRAAGEAARRFALVVPHAFLERMRPGDVDDPLLRQVLPLDAELDDDPPGFRLDPVGDADAVRANGLLQKYAGRALLITTGVCAVHCRYCFRRHYPYEKAPRGLQQWEPAFATLERSPDVEEVILSGGDPLMQSDRWLAALVDRLERIPHLRRLRVHTRLPIVIPDRVDDALIDWMARTRLAPIVVVHANHPNEVDPNCGAALLRLVRAGIPVLNQSVLLRGVNDDASVLAELSRRLLDARVMPYYLHQLDPVAGAAHFEVPVERGLEIVAALRERLPGYGVPRYVREIPGAASKVELVGP
ncbi:MAG: EF-P beta-lysylation protein EpmB [Planctomycetes bacterium]|nr:EF-P beta-lysylation protein EpmB [Planctomycetota bacterium]